MENNLTNYNSSSGVAPPLVIKEQSWPSLTASAFVLSNSTGATGQQLVFTLSKCIADGNPLGFCERLRTSTSPLFVA